MPTDVPNAYIHASAKDGGLGITSLRWMAPLRRQRRLERLPLSEQAATGTPASFLQKEITQCKLRLKDSTKLLKSSIDIEGSWAELLYASVDGAGLKVLTLYYSNTLGCTTAQVFYPVRTTYRHAS